MEPTHSRWLSGNLLVCIAMYLSVIWIHSAIICLWDELALGEPSKMPCPFPSLPAYVLSSLCPSFWLFSPSPPSKLSSWIPYGMTWGLWFIGYGYFYRSNLEWVWLKSISLLFSAREPPPHQWFPREQVQQFLWSFLSLCTSPGDLLGWGSWSVSEFLRDSIVLSAPHWEPGCR